jgi:flagellar biosynthesis component FlhA
MYDPGTRASPPHENAVSCTSATCQSGIGYTLGKQSEEEEKEEKEEEEEEEKEEEEEEEEEAEEMKTAELKAGYARRVM